MQDLLRRAEAELVALQRVLEQKTADVSGLMLHSWGSVPRPTWLAGPMSVQASVAREREQHWRELAQMAEAKLLEEKKLTMAICSDMTRQAKVDIYFSFLAASRNPGQPEGELKSGACITLSSSMLCSCWQHLDCGAYPLSLPCDRSRALHHS